MFYRMQRQQNQIEHYGCQNRPPLVVGLNGTLGAGKTAFVQAFATSCGVDPEDVTSPTFTLCNEYVGTRRIYHLDCYRLESDDEFLDLGVEELFLEDAITFVEWSSRVANVMPRNQLSVLIEIESPTTRRFRLTTEDSSLELTLEEIHKVLQQAED